ncbi:MAG: hypothetical protein ACREA9_22185, partial [Pyrinomonadaceae bacterium]
AAGNRTSMTDGLGSVSYNYNNLGQLGSETRSFNGVGTYTLSYSYNLAGELSSITNPWGAQVGYNYDKVGRVTGISGSGYYGVSNYASALTYRAFGAIKGTNYGDGKALSTSYDNRLRPTTWNVWGVLGYNYNYDYLNEHGPRDLYAEPSGLDAGSLVRIRQRGAANDLSRWGGSARPRGQRAVGHDGWTLLARLRLRRLGERDAQVWLGR